MAKKKPNGSTEFVFFDVVYEDGSRRSNRKIPGSVLGGLDGDEPAREVIEAQDQEIAKMSGRPALTIKSITRSAGR
jgi:hypothetical protein